MLDIRVKQAVALSEEWQDPDTDWNYIMAMQMMMFGMQRLDGDTVAEFKARLAVEEKLNGPVLMSAEGPRPLPLAVVDAYATAMTSVNVAPITRPEYLRQVTAAFFKEADRAKTERAAREAEARRKAQKQRRIG
jgi:hypothetical protein